MCLFCASHTNLVEKTEFAMTLEEMQCLFSTWFHVSERGLLSSSGWAFPASSTLTYFGKDDAVLSSTLGTTHASNAVALLLLIQPSLEASLVDPLGGSFATTRTNPLGRPVIAFSSKTHPAMPGRQREREKKRKEALKGDPLLHSVLLNQKSKQEDQNFPAINNWRHS